jgi:tetratricopeptide (TPR) repeat protein
MVEASIASARRAVAINPANPDAHESLGIGLLTARQAQAGIAELRTAVTLEPDLVQGHAYLAIAYRNEGKIDEALQQIHEALRYHPDPRTKALLTQALSQLQQKNAHGTEGCGVNPAALTDVIQQPLRAFIR